MTKHIPNFAHIRRVKDRQVLGFVDHEVTEEGQHVFFLLIMFDSIARHRGMLRVQFNSDLDADAALTAFSIGKMDERLALTISDADMLDAAKN